MRTFELSRRVLHVRSLKLDFSHTLHSNNNVNEKKGKKKDKNENNYGNKEKGNKWGFCEK